MIKLALINQTIALFLIIQNLKYYLLIKKIRLIDKVRLAMRKNLVEL